MVVILLVLIPLVVIPEGNLLFPFLPSLLNSNKRFILMFEYDQYSLSTKPEDRETHSPPGNLGPDARQIARRRRSNLCRPGLPRRHHSRDMRRQIGRAH